MLARNVGDVGNVAVTLLLADLFRVVPATDEGRIEAAPALASWTRLTRASLRRPAEHFQRPLTHSMAASSYR